MRDGVLDSWAVADGEGCWVVDAAAVPLGAPEVAGWLQGDALKVTWFDPARWAALAACGLQPRGVVDAGLAVGLLTAGLDACPSRAAVMESFGVADIAPDAPEFAGALVELWPVLDGLLRESDLAWTARLEARVAPHLAAVAAAGLPVDQGLWACRLGGAERMLSTLPEMFAEVTCAPRRLDGGPAVNLDRDVDVSRGFARLGRPARSLRTSELARVAETGPRDLADAVEIHACHNAARTLRAWASHPVPDGRLRAVWRQLGANSGRVVVEQPNLHAFPSALRDAVRAPSGIVLVAADYGGQEIRTLAGLSGDRRLINETHGDLYAAVARRVGVERHAAKEMVLATFYGASSRTVAALGDQPAAVASRLVRALRESYPDAWGFLGKRPTLVRLPVPLARLTGRDGDVVEARAGGRRRLADPPKPGRDRARLDRALRNFRVQGPAASMGKLALVGASQRLARSGEGAIVHFVTDELIAEVPVGCAPAVEAALGEAMGAAHDRVTGGLVPAVTSVGSGASWADAVASRR